MFGVQKTLISNMVIRLFLVNVLFEEQAEKDNIKIDIMETGLENKLYRYNMELAQSRFTLLWRWGASRCGSDCVSYLGSAEVY